MVLIPFPKKCTPKPGCFLIKPSSVILLDNSCDYNDFEAARSLQKDVERMTGIRPAIHKGSTEPNKMPCLSESPIILIRNDRSLETGKTRSSNKSGGRAAFAQTGRDAGKNAGEDAGKDAYSLNVQEDRILVTGFSGTGLFYGIQTLRQLVRNDAAALSCVEIEDSPDFGSRGFYHDITRGRIPTLETLKELADRLSYYKINQLQLYMEHTFAFKNHSEIWIDSDPITAEEILILDEYCKRRGIELVPSLSTFGHLYHALTSKSFKHLNEYENVPDDPFTWVDRMQHYTLDVSNPQSLEFVYAMIDEFLPLFSSDKFNICCDETFDLGMDRNRALVDDMGKGKLYLYFARNIVNHVKAYHKTVMMWGDILLKYPEVLGDLPEDVILLNWDYSGNPPELGVKAIAEAGLQQYGCPGAQGWNRLVNDLDTAFQNIAAMVCHASKYKACGILNTDWGDFGHINPLAGSIPAAIYGAGLSWNAGDPKKPSDADISKLEYGDGSGRLVGLVRELSRQALLDWGPLVLWYYKTVGLKAEPPQVDLILNRMLELKEDKIKNSYSRILELENELSALAGSVYTERLPDVKELLVSADGLALFQALLLVIKRDFLGQKDTGLIFSPQELAGKLEYWFARYKVVWRARDRESELYRIKEVIMGICGLLRS